MRTVTNYLAFENLFPNLPNPFTATPSGEIVGDAQLYSFSQKIFNPTVRLVEEDCGTLLGNIISLDKNSIGKVSLKATAEVEYDVGFRMNIGLVTGTNPVTFGPQYTADFSATFYSIAERVIGDGDTLLVSQGPNVLYSVIEVDPVAKTITAEPEFQSLPLSSNQEVSLRAYSIVAKDDVLTGSKVTALLTQGTKVGVRSLSTCVSEEGVCKKCYRGAYPSTSARGDAMLSFPPASSMSDGQYFTLWSANDAEQFYVLYNIDAGVTDPAPGGMTRILVNIAGSDNPSSVALKTYQAINSFRFGSVFYTTNYFQDSFDVGHYSYAPATTLASNFDVTDLIITDLRVDVDGAVTLTLPSLTPFHSYLAHTYSGGMLGFKPFSKDKLPLREGLLISMVTDNDIAVAYRRVSKMPSIPPDLLQYLNSIEQKLEKILFLIMLYGMFTYVKVS